MTDKKSRALIPLPSGGLANIGSGPKSILSGMVSDALALARAREQSLAAARFRIGDYEFRDPDYRQILIWAKALVVEPEALIEGLNCIPNDSYNNWVEGIAELIVQDGSINILTWDFHTFPISSFEWVDELRVEQIMFLGLASAEISLDLPSLIILSCLGCGLTELDLSAVPALTSLFCYDNQLIELDLSAVPKLTEISCSGNQLVDLDLSAVPKLTELYCQDNQLVKLDLSNVPALTGLNCSNNQLVELDLSAVPELYWLDCQNNQLVELDIRGLRRLKWLYCDPFVRIKKLPTQNF